jgi:hypothetical protein
MNKYLLFLLFPLILQAKQIRVGVIDTGHDVKNKSHLCSGDHKDFTNTNMQDTLNHGWQINRLIIHNAGKDSDFCLIIMKSFDSSTKMNYTTEALKYTYKKLNVDILNLSFSGIEPDENEKYYIKKLLDKGVVIIAAAGNQNIKLNYDDCRAFPACVDPRIIVAGCLDSFGKKCKSSNYGNYIDIWQKVIYPGGATSHSCAITTGQYIRWKYFKRLPMSQEQTAISKAAEALYKQSGFEKYLNEKKDKYIHPYLQETIGWGHFFYNSYYQKKIYYEHKWRF